MPSSTSTVGFVRKQVLPLKSKTTNYVQRLENKPRVSRTPSEDVPVTNLELKKKKKAEKNTVVNLAYRKPFDKPSNRDIELLLARSKLPASPASSGYDTDGILDYDLERNDHVFTSNLFSPLVRTCEMCYGTAMIEAQMQGLATPPMSNGPWATHDISDHFSSESRFAFLTNIANAEQSLYHHLD